MYLHKPGCYCLLYTSIQFLIFIHVVMFGYNLFFFPAAQYRIMQKCHSWFVLQLMNIWAVSSFSAFIRSEAMSLLTGASVWGLYPEVELLACWVWSRSALRDSATLFSIMAVTIYSFQSSDQWWAAALLSGGLCTKCFTCIIVLNPHDNSIYRKSVNIPI